MGNNIIYMDQGHIQGGQWGPYHPPPFTVFYTFFFIIIKNMGLLGPMYANLNNLFVK